MADPGFRGPGSIIGPLSEWFFRSIREPAQERYGGVPGQPWNPMPQLRALGDIFSVGPNVAQALPRAESPGGFAVDLAQNFDPNLTYMDLQRDRFEQPETDEDLTRRSPFSVHADMLRGEVDPADVRQAWERSLSQSLGLGLDVAQPGAEVVGPLMGALASFGTFMKMSPRNWAGVVDNLARNPNAARANAEGFRALNTLDPAGDILHTVGRQVDNARVTRTNRGQYELVIRGDGDDMLTVTRDFGDLRNFDPTAPVPQNALYVDYRGDSMLTDLGALAELADSQGTTLYVSTGGGFRPMQGTGTIPENVAPRFDQLGFELGGTVNDMDALYVRRPYPLDEAARRQEMAARGVEQGRIGELSEDMFRSIDDPRVASGQGTYSRRVNELDYDRKKDLVDAFNDATINLSEGNNPEFVRDVLAALDEVGATPRTAEDLEELLQDIWKMTPWVGDDDYYRAYNGLARQIGLPVEPPPGALPPPPKTNSRFIDPAAGDGGPDFTSFAGGMTEPTVWSNELRTAFERGDVEGLASRLNISPDIVSSWGEGFQRAARAGREQDVARIVDEGMPYMENLRNMVGKDQLSELITTMRRAGYERSIQGLHSMFANPSTGRSLSNEALAAIVELVFLGTR